MAWNSKYWDIIDQLYWSPGYMGLRSINQRHWQVEGDRISVPVEMVNRSGPLYSHGRKISDLIEDLHSKEEILNHVFDLTFAIAPDDLIETCFLRPFGFADHGPFESIGREVQSRYAWGSQENVTQQDGLFISANSIIGVELKLGSSSWPGQIAKYLSLLAWEEKHSGVRDNLGLLFIAPDAARSTHWSKCGLASNRIDETFLDTTFTRPLPGPIQRLFTDERDHLADILKRMRLEFISWAELRATLETYTERLDPSRPGDQTLNRLVDGFLAQLASHRATGLTAPVRN